MNDCRRPLPFVATIVVACSFALAATAAAEDEVVLDHWFAQFSGETKTGWSHVRRVRSERDGVTVLVTDNESRVLRTPQGELMQEPIHSTAHFVEDESGTVIEYATSFSFGTTSQTRTGTVKDGTVSAVDDGKPRSIPYAKGAIGPAAFDRLVAAALQPSAQGKALEFSPHDPDKGEPVTWKVPAQTQLVDVLGKYAWLFPVQKTDSSTIPETLFPDGAGGAWGGALNFGTITYFRTEELVAKADRPPTTWLTDRIVAPDRVIPPAALRKRTLLRLTRADSAAIELPESKFQRVVSRGENGSVDLELLDGEPKGDLVIWMRPYNGDDQEPGYLAATPLVELANERLQKFAGMAVGDVQDGLGCARMLELRVKQIMRPAPANVGFGSACDLISSRTGDSTEAAVLTVAFARSLGLPARLVAGFVYWGPDQWPGGDATADHGEQGADAQAARAARAAAARERGAFAFHTWAEIFAGDDLWHPVDPLRMDGTEPQRSPNDLRGHGGFDATHVAVLRSDLATGTPFTDIVAPVLEFMDGLTIEVLEPTK